MNFVMFDNSKLEVRAERGCVNRLPVYLSP
jgi:hypothetical protein